MSHTFTYDQALRALHGALAFGIEPSLEGIRALLGELGNPQTTFASIQVAGTNGKTSTARMIAALVESQGLRSGLYTSPELVHYPERIEVAGRVISNDEFATAIGTVVDSIPAAEAASGRPITEFEILTAAALWEFARQEVDIAVLEVGLGGTWDSTSVVDPAVAVITGVGLDHTAILGDTLEEIAREKAGIIKPASTPVLGPGTAITPEVEDIFLKRAEACDTHARLVREEGAPTKVDEQLTIRFSTHSEAEGENRKGSLTSDRLRRKERACRTRSGTPSDSSPTHGDWTTDVQGAHAEYPLLTVPGPAYQGPNVATALAAVEAALGRGLTYPAAREALESLVIPGRFEQVTDEPTVIIDGSHNPQAAEVLAGEIRHRFGNEKPTILLGMLADKDARGFVEAIAPVAGSFVVAQPPGERALPARELARIVGEITGVVPATYETVGEALEGVLGKKRPVIVTGSIKTAGEAKRYLC